MLPRIYVEVLDYDALGPLLANLKQKLQTLEVCEPDAFFLPALGANGHFKFTQLDQHGTVETRLKDTGLLVELLVGKHSREGSPVVALLELRLVAGLAVLVEYFLILCNLDSDALWYVLVGVVVALIR